MKVFLNEVLRYIKKHHEWLFLIALVVISYWVNKLLCSFLIILLVTFALWKLMRLGDLTKKGIRIGLSKRPTSNPCKHFCSTSALKTLYFFLFMYAAYDLFRSLYAVKPDFIESIAIGSGPLSPDGILAQILYISICALFSLHIIRVYITLKLLEDPFSTLHGIFIPPLGEVRRFLEQMFRYICILIVSLKFVKHAANSGPLKFLDFAYINTNGNSIHYISKYLLLLYIVLLCWDVIVFPLRRKDFKKRLKFSILYSILSLIGLFCSLHIYHCTSTDKIPVGSRESVMIALSILIISIASSLIGTIITSWREFLFVLSESVEGIFEPFYNRQYNI